MFQGRQLYLDVDRFIAVEQLQSGVVNGRENVDKAQMAREIPRVDEVTTETDVDVERQ